MRKIFILEIWLPHARFEVSMAVNMEVEVF